MSLDLLYPFTANDTFSCKGTNVEAPCFTKASNSSVIVFCHTRNLEAFVKIVVSKSLFEFVYVATKIFFSWKYYLLLICIGWEFWVATVGSISVAMTVLFSVFINEASLSVVVTNGTVGSCKILL